MAEERRQGEGGDEALDFQAGNAAVEEVLEYGEDDVQVAARYGKMEGADSLANKSVTKLNSA